jgi:hypothetical protein
MAIFFLPFPLFASYHIYFPSLLPFFSPILTVKKYSVSFPHTLEMVLQQHMVGISCYLHADTRWRYGLDSSGLAWSQMKFLVQTVLIFWVAQMEGKFLIRWTANNFSRSTQLHQDTTPFQNFPVWACHLATDIRNTMKHCVPTLWLNKHIRLLVPSLLAEQWTMSNCKQVTRITHIHNVMKFNLSLDKTP